MQLALPDALTSCRRPVDQSLGNAVRHELRSRPWLHLIRAEFSVSLGEGKGLRNRIIVEALDQDIFCKFSLHLMSLLVGPLRSNTHILYWPVEGRPSVYVLESLAGDFDGVCYFADSVLAALYAIPV